MNEGKTIFDLPQAETVPAGSRYIVEMGDGSGTKSVTHEDVVKAVSGDLPLGDVEALMTDEKTDFVSAINEINKKADASSGGATLQVKTSDPGLYGRTVTVSDGKNAVTGIMSYGGECVITGVILSGELTISASTEAGEEDETTVNVKSYGTYYTELDTRQEYNRLNVVTSDGGLIGRVVTVSNGTDSMTAVISQDGRARIVFAFTGIVTVTVTASDAAGHTANASVNVTSDVTVYNVYLQLGNMISDAFSVEKTYAAGKYCIYENELYKFTAAKTAGAWDPQKVVATSVDAELSALNVNMDPKFVNLSISDVLENYEDQFTVSTAAFKVQRNILSVYLEFVTKELTSHYFATLKEGYRPATTYAIAPVRSNVSPFVESGNLWLCWNGTVTHYGLENNKRYYTYFSFACID